MLRREKRQDGHPRWEAQLNFCNLLLVEREFQYLVGKYERLMIGLYWCHIRVLLQRAWQDKRISMRAGHSKRERYRLAFYLNKSRVQCVIRHSSSQSLQSINERRSIHILR